MELNIPESIIKRLEKRAGAKASNMTERGLVLDAISQYLNEDEVVLSNIV